MLLKTVRIALCCLTLPGLLPGQTQPVFSMGQPPQWKPYVFPSAWRATPSDWYPALALGVHRSVTNPVTGLLGFAGEVYTVGTQRPRPAARLLATSRAFGLAAGADWDGQDNVDFMLSFQTAIRRGGLLGHGTMLRVDWLPTRRDALSLGLHVPIAQPFAGRTRGADVDVDEPVDPDRIPLFVGTVPKDAEPALDAVARAATMILAYTNLFAEDTALVRYGESHTAAMRTYVRGLQEAFGVAANDPTMADEITRRARAGLLAQVILPYDSLFGQVKEHANSIRPLTASAQTAFVDWLRDSTRLGGSARAAVASVHARWMHIIEAVHANLLLQWKDSRLVWLPLQLALTDEETDEQAELDALIERAIGRPFTDRNSLAYLRSSDLPLEIARSILAAREYHVLWTHDFAGRRDETKALDAVGYTMVADAYFPALTAAVQRFDSAGHIPAYIILLDEFYYEQRDGRLWMTMLEDPLNADVSLPGNNAAREAHLRERQAELRAAVARSRVNPRDVRVHVNILLPSDFSFRSHRIVPPWPFVPDNIMRDHRKVVFYDITESDPYRGAMILMGVGIGEHYASATWEDRGYRVRGPAALEIRNAARRALVRNGVSESRIPAPLRATPADTADDDEDFVGRALLLTNEAGFGEKESSVARAMLYDLAPPGSVIIVPDPLWVSDTWASMLAGAATRGVKVYVIAPSKANGPNPQAPVIAREHAVMRHLLEIRHRLADQIERVGGELRVGLYTSKTDVTDVAGRAREMREGLARAPWIRNVIPFDDATLAALDRALVETEADGPDATDIATDESPRLPMLHAKAQLVARPGAIRALVSQPGWGNVLARAMRAQSRQSAQLAEELNRVGPPVDVDSSLVRADDAILRGYEQSLSPAERKAFNFYFSLGTQNMDPRGIMQDGEATLVVSGLQAAAGLADLFHMMTRTTWIDSGEQLQQLLPEPGWLMRFVGRVLRKAL